MLIPQTRTFLKRGTMSKSAKVSKRKFNLIAQSCEFQDFLRGVPYVSPLWVVCFPNYAIITLHCLV